MPRRIPLLLTLLTTALAALTPPGTAAPAQRPVLGPAHGDTLHVMSFNLRYASTTTPNSWPARRPVTAALLRTEQPTLLGTQEGLHAQLKDIEADLPTHYDWIGQGRAGGTQDEFTAIFYDTRRLTPKSSGHYWLSDTPAVPGSKSWGNRITRMVTWIHFTDRRTRTEFVAVNTHLDHESENSRLRSAELIRDRLNALPPGLPVILTGDFNTAEDTPTHHILRTTAALTDTWPAATERRTPVHATFHGYRPLVPDGPRIDWILTRHAGGIHAAAINTFARAGQFPSDHLPVQALITLPRPA